MPAASIRVRRPGRGERRPLKTEPGDFMPVLTTQLNPRSADFKANADAMRLLIDDLNAQLERIALGGGEAARASTRPAASCCRASACERLLDPGTPFLEIAPLAGLNLYDDAAPGGSVIAGIGRVAGVECVIVQRRHRQGRHLLPITVKKHLRAQEIADQNHLPCIYLVDSGGANLPNQDEVFPDRDHFGRIFYNQANLSARASRRSRW
jgi:3-methylcrotonyl-CoA carboxylase beta subunit